MKEVIIRETKEVIRLTDQEFGKAMTAWNNKQFFYSVRLEKAIPPGSVLFAGTPEAERGYVPYLHITTTAAGTVTERFYKKDNTFHYLTGKEMKEVINKGSLESGMLIMEDEHYDLSTERILTEKMQREPHLLAQKRHVDV